MELRALLVPHTYIRMDLATLALAFFDRLVLLQPSEKKPEAPFAKLIEAGLIEIVSPPPFGERLIWFERLVKSYEEWGLMMRWPENVSMFKAWPEAVEESVSEIKAELQGRKKVEDDPILRARVILQLAFDLDKRLEELDQEYEALQAKALKLTDFVLGSDPVKPRFPKWVVEGREPNWELQGLSERIKAYAVLTPLLPDLPSMITTDQLEVAENLLDVCPEKERLGSMAIQPLSWQDLPEAVLEKRRLRDTPEGNQKIQALIEGRLEETSSGPRVEAWRLKAEVRGLLASMAKLPGASLAPGETLFFYLARA